MLNYLEGIAILFIFAEKSRRPMYDDYNDDYDESIEDYNNLLGNLANRDNNGLFPCAQFPNASN